MTKGQCKERRKKEGHCRDRNLKYSTVPVVVPSPATMSCDFESSTNILAAGCVTSICERERQREWESARSYCVAAPLAKSGTRPVPFQYPALCLLSPCESSLLDLRLDPSQSCPDSALTLLRIVAPSFVMITSPVPVVTILSMPRGPKLVRTASATALAASMLACTHAREGPHKARRDRFQSQD